MTTAMGRRPSFNEINLGDAVTFQRGFDITKKEQTEGGVPIVSSSGVSSFHSQWKSRGPGVVIGRKGTLGTVHYLQADFWPHDTTLWVKDFKGNDPRLIYFFLQTLHLENFDTGASNPTLNRNHLHKIKVVFPASCIQKKIAAILSVYDDLIENNRRRIALLEKMAEEIYREWFVRMRFPGYEQAKFEKGVPAGWVVRKLPQIARITYGFPFKGERFNTSGIGKPIIRIRNIPNASTEDFTDEVTDEKYIVRKGDFLIGMDGEFHMNHWQGDDAYLVQRTCRIKAIDPLLEGYLSLALKAPIKHFESTLLGATVGHLGAKHLNSIDVLLPPEPFWQRLGVFNDFLRQKIALSSQSKNLARTRDALLPRLISGKLAVEDLDIRFPPSMAESGNGVPEAALS